MSEAQREPSRRKQLGAWYTPPELVDAVVREAVFDGAASVLDPACGDGRFLRATGLPEQTGVDIDPDTTFEHGDALQRDWGDRQFDVVVGNPPFLNQLSSLTTRGGSSAFGGGPYADSAAEFLALAMRLVRPGGRVGLVLPQSLLAARDAAAIRRQVEDVAALRWMWWSDTHMFDAAVRVWAGVWEVGGAQRQVRRAFGPRFDPRPPVAWPPKGAVRSSWSSLLADEPVQVPSPAGAVLGDVATFAVDFRDQYYGLIGAVGDDVDGPPFVTSGLIDPGVCHWGTRPVRFAKRQYVAPRVAVERLTPPLQRWAALRLVPKILIANQTKVVEAVYDEAGVWLPGVPVITCVTDRPQAVLDVLGHDDTTRWIHHHAAGSGLGRGTVRLSPALLAQVPR
ncbi:MAG: N-6 DNA methylase [Ilumatobacteraceae bacterium]